MTRYDRYDRDRRVDPDDRPVDVVREREIIRERNTGDGKSFGLGALLVLLLVAVGGFLWWNSRQANRPDTVTTTSTTDVTTPIPGDMGSTFGTDAMDEGATAFGISVGDFSDEQSAMNERSRLNSMTDLPVSMGQNTVNGVTNYQVILGSFPSRAAADSAAQTLMSSANVTTYKIVPIRQ